MYSGQERAGAKGGVVSAACEMAGRRLAVMTRERKHTFPVPPSPTRTSLKVGVSAIVVNASMCRLERRKDE